MAGKQLSKPKEPSKVADFLAYHQWAVGNTRSTPSFWGPAQEAATNTRLTPSKAWPGTAYNKIGMEEGCN